jgi:nicotinate phosphoribosyltransferase
MAHSYIQAHADEMSAFRAFTQAFPETTLLVDTYDTLAGVRKVIGLSRQLGENFKVKSIRLDSGDLAELAKESRKLLDEGGLKDMKIIASSGLNEQKIAALLASGAPIDGFGVGTDLAVSSDAPEIDFSYKLVAYDGQPRMKLSSSKLLLPDRKQVFRVLEQEQMRHDMLARFAETENGKPLLEPVMGNGQRLAAGRITLAQAREYARGQLAVLPPELKALAPAEKGYLVGTSAQLREIAETLERELTQG